MEVTVSLIMSQYMRIKVANFLELFFTGGEHIVSG